MPFVNELKEIVLAAFRVTDSNSIAYKRYKTLEGFLRGIEQIISQENPDYISVRVIKRVEK